MTNIPNCPKCGDKPQVITMITCINKACELNGEAHFKAEWLKLVNDIVKPRDASKRLYSDE